MRQEQLRQSFLSKFIGREEELGKLKRYLDDVVSGRGKTVIISGEAGVGKTRLVSEFMSYAEEKKIVCLVGECMPYIMAPYQPFIQALSSITTEPIIPVSKPETVTIEEIFLINNAGIVISHISQKGRTIDSDVVGGMLTAVQDFVKDSFGDRVPTSKLSSLEYGSYKVLLEHGSKIFLAAVTSQETSELRKDLRAVVNIVEEDYKDILKVWNGDMSKLAGTAGLVKTITSREYPVEKRMDSSILQVAKIKIYEHVLQAIAKSAKEKPMVLFFENLHWADESSLKMLHYISRNIRDIPVMIICTYRLEDITPALTESLHDMSRENLYTAFTLERLSGLDTTEIIQSSFPGIEISEQAIKRIYKETGGNPLFANALLSTLQESGDIYKSEGKWRIKSIEEIDIPTSIKDAVIGRFSRLRDEQKKILQVASVIGEEFDYNTLLTVLEMSEDELVDNLDFLVKSRMIREVPKAVGGYRFDHSKTQEAIYSELTGMRKKITHRRIAEVLEEEYKANISEVAGRLAKHYQNALNYEKASEYAIIAGDKAKLAYSPEEAVSYYSIALSALDKFEPTLANKDLKMKLVDKIAYMYYLIGEWDQSIDFTNLVMKLGVETKNEMQVAEAYRDIGIIHIPKAKYDKALENLQKALKISEEINDVSGIAEAHYWLGKAYWPSGKLDDATAHLNQCLLFCERIGDKSLAAKAYMDGGIVYDLRGDYGRSLELKMRSLNISKDMDDKYEIGRAYNNIGVTYDQKGDIDKAIEWWEKAIKINSEIGVIRGLGYGLSNIAEGYARKKEFDKAEQYTHQAKLIFEKLGERKMIAAMHRNYGIIYGGKKEWAKSESHFEEGIRIAKEIEDFESLPQIYFEYGKIYETKGDKEKAKEQFQRTIEIYDRLQNKEKAEELKRELAKL